MRLYTSDLFERISSSLAVFLNGYEHIEVLLNPCKINQDQKVWNTISRLHPSHIWNVWGGDSKDPWKGSRVNIILYLKDPMPRIESQKENKSQKTPKKAISIKTKYWPILVQDFQSSSLFLSWKNQYISHTKRHYG